MSLIGPRPRSLADLPPKKRLRPVQPGHCYPCGAFLRTSLDASLHRCDQFLTLKYRRMGERKARVRL